VGTGALPPSIELWAVLEAGGLLFVAGLVDDVRGLTPVPKLAAQLGAVAIVRASGVRVEAVNEPILATAIAVLWLVGMTNAINLLDHMDGVAATLAAVACGLFAIDAVSGHPSRVVLAVSLSVGCACLGFLPFNLRPRRKAAAFMGDSGSQVLGFMLGSLALLSTWKAAAPSLATVLLPVLVLVVPILDTTLVTTVRLLRHRPVHAGGRDHTAHRLVYGGLSERRAVVVLAALAAAVGGTGLVYSAVDSVQLTLAGVIFTFAVLAEFAGALAALDERQRGDLFSLVRALELQSRRVLYVAGDFVLVSAAFAAAYAVRFHGLGPAEQQDLFAKALPVVLAARYAFFIVFGLYSSGWEAARARGIARVVAAVCVSEGVAVGLVALSDRTAFDVFSRSVFALDAAFCTVLVIASRLAAPTVARLVPRLAYAPARDRVLEDGRRKEIAQHAGE
jgi:UDP-GlcNAc:undecaprenyl-phosphate/decaprenyl-phosphate GlcNAc-1-phosphate transferase